MRGDGDEGTRGRGGTHSQVLAIGRHLQSGKKVFKRTRAREREKASKSPYAPHAANFIASNQWSNSEFRQFAEFFAMYKYLRRQGSLSLAGIRK